MRAFGRRSVAKEYEASVAAQPVSVHSTLSHELPSKTSHGADPMGHCSVNRHDLASKVPIQPRVAAQRIAANYSASECHHTSSDSMGSFSSTPHAEQIQPWLTAQGLTANYSTSESHHMSSSFQPNLTSTPEPIHPRGVAQVNTANRNVLESRHTASVSTPNVASTPHLQSHVMSAKQEPKQSNGEGRVRVIMEPSPGHSFVVCPCLPYRIENSFHVKVVRANFGESCASDGRGITQIQLTGEWKRASAGVGARWDADAAIVVLTLAAQADVSAGRPRVIAAEGPGRFARCAREQWVLTKVGGSPITTSFWINQLVPGVPFLLQRPPEIPLVLRKPDVQIPRLLSEFAEKCPANPDLENDCNVSRLLAAPAGGGSGVAIVASLPAKDRPFIHPHALEELEDRFGVVFAHPAMRAENVLAENAPEGLLRQLLAHGLASVLHRRGWIFVETPLRLCLSEVLGGSNPQRANVRVPSIDVACDAAWVENGNLIFDMVLRPSVRLAQPLDGFLASAENRQGGSLYASDRTVALHQPPIHVLPQLTAAAITHIHYEGLSGAKDLPANLYTEREFSEYWRLVHGYRLPSSALGGFARVEFQNSGLALTYPLACLWRSSWTIQPMLSLSHAPKILQLVLLSLKQFTLLGGSQSLQLLEGIAATMMPEPTIDQTLSQRPALLPISRVHQRQIAEAACGEATNQMPRTFARESHMKGFKREHDKVEDMTTKTMVETSYVSGACGDTKRRKLLLPLLEGE